MYRNIVVSVDARASTSITLLYVCRVPGQARVLLLYPALVKRLSNTFRFYIRIALTCFSPALTCYGCDYDLGLVPQAVSRLDVATKSG